MGHPEHPRDAVRHGLDHEAVHLRCGAAARRQGELDLETSIHHYVDLEGTTISPAVNLLHLLTHTSGIADDADEEAGESYEDLFLDTPNYSLIETKDFLPQFVHKEPLAPPGVDCRYCNVGYVLAGLAIEKVTGLSYREYVFDYVFGPAGMADSGFYDRRDAAPRVAEGWEQHEDGTWFSNIYSYPPIGSPDGGAHVTAPDLVRFIQAVRGGELLDAEYTEEFFVPQVEHIGTSSLAAEATWYGFGLEFDMNEDGSVRSYYKEGINVGASRHHPPLPRARPRHRGAVELRGWRVAGHPRTRRAPRRLTPPRDRGFETRRFAALLNHRYFVRVHPSAISASLSASFTEFWLGLRPTSAPRLAALKMPPASNVGIRPLRDTDFAGRSATKVKVADAASSFATTNGSPATLAVTVSSSMAHATSLVSSVARRVSTFVSETAISRTAPSCVPSPGLRGRRTAAA